MSAVDLAPSAPSYTFTNNYTVNWHHPDEHWQQLAVAPVASPQITIPKTPAVGGTLSYTYQDSVDINYKQGVGVASGSISLLAATVTFFSGGEIPVTVLYLLSGALNITSTSLNAPTPPAPQFIPVDYADFKKDALEAEGIVAPDPNSNISGNLIVISNDPFERQELLASLQDETQTNPYWGAGVAPNPNDPMDERWKKHGHLQVEALVTIKREDQKWQSEGYDKKGFVGLGESHVQKTVSHKIVRTWTFNNLA